MMIEIEICMTFLLLNIFAAESTFDCRRPNQECSNEGVCRFDSPHCVCPSGFRGYDCGLNTSKVDTGDCPSSPCVPGQGVCYDEGGDEAQTAHCYCVEDYYGDSCSEERFTVTCTQYYMVVGINPFGNFTGVAYIMGTRGTPGCEANPVPSLSSTDRVPDRWEGYYMVLDHIGHECGDATVIETEDSREYRRLIVIQYSPDYMTGLDDLFTVSCDVNFNGSNVNSKVAKISPSLENLNSIVRSATTSPVYLAVTVDGAAINNQPITIGSEIRFYFAIPPDFESMLILSGEATNNNRINTRTLTIIENSCIHRDAFMVTVQPPQRQSGGTNKREISLVLRAFRFTGYDEVVYSFSVKICSISNDMECDPVDCTKTKRRRRSVRDGTRVERVVRVRDPFLTTDGPTSTADCSRETTVSVIYLAVIIVLVALLCFFISLRLIHTKYSPLYCLNRH